MGQPGVGRDDVWLAALFVRHSAQIRTYALRRVTPDAVDDIVSEVFGAAWAHRHALPEQELPWLYRTALHYTMHECRARRRSASLTDRIRSLDPPDRHLADLADEAVERLDAVALVRHVLGMLGPRDAEILRLWAWEQFSSEEIAYVLGCSAVAARVRLHRAKRRAERLLVVQKRVPAPTAVMHTGISTRRTDDDRSV